VPRPYSESRPIIEPPFPETSVPPTVDDTVGWYDVHADALARQYEAVPAAKVHAWLGSLLPSPLALFFDIGAGTGRNAAWLASQGHQVVVVEPSGATRRQGQILHPDDRLRWLDDRLPTLTATLRLGLAAEVILLSGVWQHVAPTDRPCAFRKLVTLLHRGVNIASEFTLKYISSWPVFWLRI
jgi:SAM-dependent methyltransferase